MKVLMLNGSSNPKGCTNTALTIIGEELNKNGIDYEIFQMNNSPVRDCCGCGKCSDKGCIFDDDRVNEFIAKSEEFDGFIFGTPVYYAHPSGRIQSFLDRVFYSSKKKFMFKPGSSIVVARRAGTTAALDVLNKYFTISCMPLVSSSYWNMVHGSGKHPEQVFEDLEGVQIMKNVAINMTWMLKNIEAGKKAGIELPALKSGDSTNFIR